MKASLATLSLAMLMLSACSSSSATPDNNTLDARSRGTVIETKFSNTQPPELPDGCAFDMEDPVSYVLSCGLTAGFLSRVELSTVTPPMVESHIVGMQQSLEKGRWTVTRGDSYEITADAGIIELIHMRAEREGELVHSFSGFAPTGPERYRYFTCFLPDQLVDQWAGECAIRLRLLRGLADAHKVTGFRLRGEAVEIPEECRALEGGVACENNAFTWTEYTRRISESELRGRERTLIRTFPDALELDVTCAFLGEPVECNGKRVEKEGYLSQLVIFGYTTINDTMLRLICEAAVPAEGPQTLPACDVFMDIELAE